MLSRFVDEPSRVTAVLQVRAGAGVSLRRQAISIVPGAPGWDVVTVTMPHVQRVADEAAGFGADVIVLEPAAARAAVIERLRAVAAGVGAPA
jgi:proteasome accessory factor B